MVINTDKLILSIQAFRRRSLNQFWTMSKILCFFYGFPLHHYYYPNPSQQQEYRDNGKVQPGLVETVTALQLVKTSQRDLSTLQVLRATLRRSDIILEMVQRVLRLFQVCISAKLTDDKEGVATFPVTLNIISCMNECCEFGVPYEQ